MPKPGSFTISHSQQIQFQVDLLENLLENEKVTYVTGVILHRVGLTCCITNSELCRMILCTFR